MDVTRVHLHNEMDIVLANRRARQLAEMIGLSFADQAKFSAAVSEITRNALEHANGGDIVFSISDEGNARLMALIKDKGAGIKDIDNILSIKSTNYKGKGNGLINARKLVDYFTITYIEYRGTEVFLGMKVDKRNLVLNESVLLGWKQHFEQELPYSPYEELKKQNQQLLEALEQIKSKSIQVETQLVEIQLLNLELEKRTLEVTQLSEERNNKNKQLEKKNKELDEFAYIVAHDLKAPLNNINGLIDYLKEHVKGSEDILEMLQVQATSMVDLINGILSYARSGRDNIQKQKVDIKLLVQNINASLVIPENMHIILDDNLPSLITEKIYLHQIFSNLIGNAIKHHDKPNGTVFVTCTAQPGLYEFIVSDNGPGIPDKKKEKIFDMFSTIKQATNMQSTGIGLAIVKKIIETKGGAIVVRDNEGGGSKFCFTWPS